MFQDLIIDGYNLLHYAGLGKVRPLPGKFEQARDQLLKRLKESLKPEELSRTTIVFDAQYAEHADRRPSMVFGMTIIFSPLGRQADDLIEDLLCAARHPKTICVISSDHRLRIAARAARASHLDSDTFLVQLDERREKGLLESSVPKISPVPHQPTVSPAGTADDWLKEFGDIDMSAIRNELQAEELRQRQPEQSSIAPLPKGKDQKRMQPTPEEAPIIPLSQPSLPPPRVVPGRPDAKPSPLATGQQPDMVDSAELSFWEKRIADAMKDDVPFQPRHPRSKP